MYGHVFKIREESSVDVANALLSAGHAILLAVIVRNGAAIYCIGCTGSNA